MNSFGIATFLVTCFCVFYVSYCSMGGSADKNKAVTKPFKKETKSAKWVLIFPVVMILYAPLLYFSQDSYAEQNKWQQVQIETQKLFKKGQINEVDLTMQDLLLGLRTQVFYQPKEAKIWFELGLAYANLKMSDVAIAAMQRAIREEKNPDWMVATAQLLNASNDAANQQTAISLLEQVVRQYPEHQSGLLTLGFAYFKALRYESAIGVWTHLANNTGLSEKSRQFILEQVQQAKVLQNKTPAE